jgi:hypothetical protein
LKKDFKKSETKWLDIFQIEKKIQSKGFTTESLVKCIGLYEELNQLNVDTIQGKISFCYN